MSQSWEEYLGDYPPLVPSDLNHASAHVALAAVRAVLGVAVVAVAAVAAVADAAVA